MAYDPIDALREEIDQQVFDIHLASTERRRQLDAQILPPTAPKIESNFSAHPNVPFRRPDEPTKKPFLLKVTKTMPCPPGDAPTTIDIRAVLSGTLVTSPECGGLTVAIAAGVSEGAASCGYVSFGDPPLTWEDDTFVDSGTLKGSCVTSCAGTEPIEYPELCGESPCDPTDNPDCDFGSSISKDVETGIWSVQPFFTAGGVFCGTPFTIAVQDFSVDIGPDPIGTFVIDMDDGDHPDIHVQWTITLGNSEAPPAGTPETIMGETAE